MTLPGSFDSKDPVGLMGLTSRVVVGLREEFLVVPVKVFTVPRCGACQAVKEFLQEQGVAFEELNVAGSIANLRQLRRLTAGREVPVTALGDQVVVGYDPAALTALLANGEGR